MCIFDNCERKSVTETEYSVTPIKYIEFGEIPSTDENGWAHFFSHALPPWWVFPVFKKTYIFIKSYLEILGII